MQTCRFWPSCCSQSELRKVLVWRLQDVKDGNISSSFGKNKTKCQPIAFPSRLKRDWTAPFKYSLFDRSRSKSRAVAEVAMLWMSDGIMMKIRQQLELDKMNKGVRIKHSTVFPRRSVGTIETSRNSSQARGSPKFAYLVFPASGVVIQFPSIYPW